MFLRVVTAAPVRCGAGQGGVGAVGRVGDVLAEHTSANSSVGRAFTECLRSLLVAAGGLAGQELTLPWQPSLLLHEHSCLLTAERTSPSLQHWKQPAMEHGLRWKRSAASWIPLHW